LVLGGVLRVGLRELKMPDNKFITLEQEIDLRRSIREVHKTEGMVGVYQVMGEVAASLEIVSEMAQELLAEEEKNRKGDNHGNV
jgi:hypothetical protein